MISALWENKEVIDGFKESSTQMKSELNGYIDEIKHL